MATTYKEEIEASIDDENIILRVLDLYKYFPVKAGFLKRTIAHVKAVDNVSFNLRVGETLGIVGESGCGKTTLGRTVLRLIEPTQGSCIYRGINLNELGGLSNKKRYALKLLRRKLQIVFQDPYASLNPRMTIKNSIGEPLVIHGIASGEEAEQIVLDRLLTVGMNETHLNRFPHEFSGGQRQRICIARALILNPDIIVLDEPTASLDVSVQAQVLNLLKDLQKEFGLSYIFISHDLSVVKHMSDRVAVLYLGKMMEIAPNYIFTKSLVHPYTYFLVSALPIPDPTLKREKVLIKGDIPSAVNPPKGCRFSTRCPYAEEICFSEEPELYKVEKDHFIACHLFDQSKGFALPDYVKKESII